MKIILVGEQGTGKSSLVRRLTKLNLVPIGMMTRSPCEIHIVPDEDIPQGQYKVVVQEYSFKDFKLSTDYSMKQAEGLTEKQLSLGCQHGISEAYKRHSDHRIENSKFFALYFVITISAAKVEPLIIIDVSRYVVADAHLPNDTIVSCQMIQSIFNNNPNSIVIAVFDTEKAIANLVTLFTIAKINIPLLEQRLLGVVTKADVSPIAFSSIQQLLSQQVIQCGLGCYAIVWNFENADQVEMMYWDFKFNTAANYSMYGISAVRNRVKQVFDESLHQIVQNLLNRRTSITDSDVNTIQTLLQCGANCNQMVVEYETHSIPIVFVIVLFREYSLALHMIEKWNCNVNINCSQMSLLHWTMVHYQSNSDENALLLFLKYLLETKQVALESCNSQNINLLLHLLCTNPNYSPAVLLYIMQHLKNKNINLNGQTLDEESPLQLAIQHQCWFVARELVKRNVAWNGQQMDVCREVLLQIEKTPQHEYELLLLLKQIMLNRYSLTTKDVNTTIPNVYYFGPSTFSFKEVINRVNTTSQRFVTLGQKGVLSEDLLQARRIQFGDNRDSVDAEDTKAVRDWQRN